MLYPLKQQFHIFPYLQLLETTILVFAYGFGYSKCPI
jgi:hypothetical protein